MGLLADLTRWLRREGSDIKASLDDLTEDLDHSLSAKEAELTATPEEKLARIQREIDDTPSGDDLSPIEGRLRADQDAAAARSRLDQIRREVVGNQTEPPPSKDAQ